MLKSKILEMIGLLPNKIASELQKKWLTNMTKNNRGDGDFFDDTHWMLIWNDIIKPKRSQYPCKLIEQHLIIRKYTSKCGQIYLENPNDIISEELGIRGFMILPEIEHYETCKKCRDDHDADPYEDNRRERHLYKINVGKLESLTNNNIINLMNHKKSSNG